MDPMRKSLKKGTDFLLIGMGEFTLISNEMVFPSSGTKSAILIQNKG
ncbi:hypothetical protein LEP1GSC203_0850 [Leptospira terpstrae serovar Hualin str. LT 11-33 = ATCC 700639]|uniref:Uncharacterized protein n=1 Tax=Leptospira terpstrae serovar Hualin str. LT 11-33 = ATCC 700639 TaxID=1257025 RepID=N1VXF9_9LEPT|nr:hypothetical protein LEP1GSC203_0850 [Leptospira terpstrae serovar Hualin str. LT 11-33 = ATCC 700639]